MGKKRNEKRSGSICMMQHCQSNIRSPHDDASWLSYTASRPPVEPAHVLFMRTYFSPNSSFFMPSAFS